MKKLPLILICMLVASLSFAEIPEGFSNKQKASGLMEAWKDKSLYVPYDSFQRDMFGEEAMCWEFNDFVSGKMYVLKTDGTKELKGTKLVEVHEYINVDSPGYTPGEYVLQIESVGFTFRTGFGVPVDPAAETFKDKHNKTFEIKPKGFCEK